MTTQTSLTTIVCVIVLSIAAISMHGCHQLEETKRAAYQAGLEQIQLEGSRYTRLGRPSDTNK
jgi:uncharacterized lipoprotein YehR (DUF1307 family)